MRSSRVSSHRTIQRVAETTSEGSEGRIDIRSLLLDSHRSHGAPSSSHEFDERDRRLGEKYP